MPLYGKAICLLFAAVAVVVVVVVVIVAAICGFSSNNTVTRTSVILEHPSYTSSIYETKSHIYSRISNVLAILSHEKNEQKKNDSRKSGANADYSNANAFFCMRACAHILPSFTIIVYI